jgi:hypothetical protein
MFDARQIERRKPLWIALSKLWLDTELKPEDLENIARIMADSGLTIKELREVYLVEVAPVVSPNLCTVAGEWAGFDEEWLCSQIVRNLRDRPRRTRFWSWFPLSRRTMIYATEQYWKRLVDLVQRRRGRKRTA